MLAGLAACDRKKGQPVGIGNYKFGHTTRANIYDGICQPTELNDGRKATWCFALPPVKIGQRVADVDAYFLGQETEGNAKLPEKERKPALEKMPLLEVQFKIRGCVESEAEQWIRQRFGPQAVEGCTRGVAERLRLDRRVSPERAGEMPHPLPARRRICRDPAHQRKGRRR
jgi:hypothetical protein